MQVESEAGHRPASDGLMIAACRRWIRAERGFTLVEILIAVAIVSILVTISVPVYKDYMLKVRRSDGRAALVLFAMAMERQYVRFGHYNETATVADIYQDSSDRGYYTLDIPTLAAASFVLSATPTGQQADDTYCGTLKLDYLGNKTATGSGGDDCW